MRNFILCALFSIVLAGQAHAMLLTADRVGEPQALLPYCSWLVDREGELAIGDVSAGSIPERFAPLNAIPLKESGPVWIRLALIKSPPSAGGSVPLTDKPRLLINLGQLPQGNNEIYFSESPGPVNAPGVWHAESIRSHEDILLPEPGLLPMSVFIRMESMPGPWFAPIVQAEYAKRPDLLPSELLLPGLLIAAGIVCLLRAAAGRAQWAFWSALFLATGVCQAVLPLPGLARGLDFKDLPALLAPGLAVVLLPHVGRCMFRTDQESKGHDLLLYFCSLLGAGAALAPLAPGLGWLSRLFPLTPLLLFPLLPLCAGALSGKRPGSLAFTGAVVMPMLGAGLSLYTLMGQPLHPLAAPLAAQGGLWGMAVGGLGLALARMPRRDEAEQQSQRPPVEQPGLALAESAADAARAEAEGKGLSLNMTQAFVSQSQYDELPPLPVSTASGLARGEEDVAPAATLDAGLDNAPGKAQDSAQAAMPDSGPDSAPYSAPSTEPRPEPSPESRPESHPEQQPETTAAAAVSEAPEAPADGDAPLTFTRIERFQDMSATGQEETQPGAEAVQAPEPDAEPAPVQDAAPAPQAAPLEPGAHDADLAAAGPADSPEFLDAEAEETLHFVRIEPFDAPSRDAAPAGASPDAPEERPGERFGGQADTQPDEQPGGLFGGQPDSPARQDSRDVPDIAPATPAAVEKQPSSSSVMPGPVIPGRAMPGAETGKTPPPASATRSPHAGEGGAAPKAGPAAKTAPAAPALPAFAAASDAASLPATAGGNVISLVDEDFSSYSLAVMEELADGPARHITLTPEGGYLFNLHSLVREVHDIVAPFAKSRGLIFSWFIAPSLPVLLEGDAPRLRGALSLLLQNAVQASRQGAVQLAVRRRPGATSPGDLLFTISDNGSAQRTDAGFFHAWELAAKSGGAFNVDYSPAGGTRISFSVRFSLPSEDAARDHLALAPVSGPLAEDLTDELEAASARAAGGTAGAASGAPFADDPAAPPLGEVSSIIAEYAAKTAFPAQMREDAPEDAPEDRPDSTDDRPPYRGADALPGLASFAGAAAPGTTVMTAATAVWDDGPVLLEEPDKLSDPLSAHISEHHKGLLAEPEIPAAVTAPGLPAPEPRVIAAEMTTSKRKLLAHYLQGLPYDLVHAASNAELLELAREAVSALYLFDGDMPEPDIIKTMTALRGMAEGSSRRSPVLVLTGHETQSERLKRAGAEFTLVKPFAQEELRDIVAMALPMPRALTEEQRSLPRPDAARGATPGAAPTTSDTTPDLPPPPAPRPVPQAFVPRMAPPEREVDILKEALKGVPDSPAKSGAPAEVVLPPIGAATSGVASHDRPAARPAAATDMATGPASDQASDQASAPAPEVVSSSGATAKAGAPKARVRVAAPGIALPPEAPAGKPAAPVIKPLAETGATAPEAQRPAPETGEEGTGAPATGAAAAAPVRTPVRVRVGTRQARQTAPARPTADAAPETPDAGAPRPARRPVAAASAVRATIAPSRRTGTEAPAATPAAADDTDILEKALRGAPANAGRPSVTVSLPPRHGVAAPVERAPVTQASAPVVDAAPAAPAPSSAPDNTPDDMRDMTPAAHADKKAESGTPDATGPDAEEAARKAAGVTAAAIASAPKQVAPFIMGLSAEDVTPPATEAQPETARPEEPRGSAAEPVAKAAPTAGEDGAAQSPASRPDSARPDDTRPDNAWSGDTWPDTSWSDSFWSGASRADDSGVDAITPPTADAKKSVEPQQSAPAAPPATPGPQQADAPQSTPAPSGGETDRPGSLLDFVLPEEQPDDRDEAAPDKAPESAADDAGASLRDERPDDAAAPAGQAPGAAAPEAALTDAAKTDDALTDDTESGDAGTDAAAYETAEADDVAPETAEADDVAPDGAALEAAEADDVAPETAAHEAAGAAKDTGGAQPAPPAYADEALNAAARSARPEQAQQASAQPKQAQTASTPPGYPLPGIDGEYLDATVIPLAPGIIFALGDILKDVEEAQTNGSAMLMQDATARLAGKAEHFGLHKLGKIARCVERAAEAGDMEAVSTLYEDLAPVTRRYIDAIQECFQNFLSINY